MRLSPIYNRVAIGYPNGLLIAGVEIERSWVAELSPGPAEFGVLGTPTVILFQGRKEIARYNNSDPNFQQFNNWLHKHSKLPLYEIKEEELKEDSIPSEPIPTELTKPFPYGVWISYLSLALVIFVRKCFPQTV
ncbi:Oidioi.mRNA.OKI2018_I69.chr2.g6497.t1.cds [Oikopleura dioica]|uniref:Oidioi.mRNA.OKI2018_I69.chr2.g6497.t1.cds n=1 Tax=Oikopleura dioica TaxID=34765 RepID=A0ABN7T3A7_OIKDI|nr:Oidioi.mRNA.OKI2018_I69.chr2.g6497.t1.cds [Oikopleura dioica]